MPSSVSRIRELSHSTNLQVVAASASTLWRWGEPASESVAILINLLWEKEAKSPAAADLGAMGPEAKAAVPLLLRASQEDIGAWVDRYDRAMCALAVFEISGPDEIAVKELEAALRFRENPWVRGAVARDLARLGKLSAPLLPALRSNARDDPDVEVRHSASVALETIEKQMQ